MDYCMVCELKEAKWKFSKAEVDEDLSGCCEECFDTYYAGDEELTTVINVG